MTAAETDTPVRHTSTRSAWRPYLAFGTGAAIEIVEDSLSVALVRVRPGGPELMRTGVIERFRERPAAEWSAQFRQIVKGHDSDGIIVLLPRHEVLVRHVQMPGVTRRELAGALALRLRGLHPFSEDDVAWCWAPAMGGALVGVTRLSTLGRYESLFAEAGIAVASFTFPAAVLHAAMRLYGEPARPFLGFAETQPGLFEAYGESASGAVFSGEVSGSRSRAARFGVSELRLSDGIESIELERLLPDGSPGDGEAKPVGRPLVYAAAITAACPLLLRPANFLPPERRAGQSGIWLIPTAVLSLTLILGLIAVFSVGPYRERRYLEKLHAEIEAATPAAQRASIIDRQIQQARGRIQVLDGFRARTRDDFDVLDELTRLLPPPTWTAQVEIFPEYVLLSGETDQAAPLLQALDSSPFFHNSEFTNSVARAGQNELFRIKTYRRHP
jgi:Tfp pilus assembly protein PilN